MASKDVKFTLTAVDKTKAAFDKVTRGLKTVGGAAASVTKGVAGVGAAVTGAALAFGVFTKKSFEYIDTLDKTSKRTGIATDTLQAFQLAALESGSSVEQAQKGLEKFARSVGDAQRGLKTQADIFKDLGVEIANSDGTTRDFNDILLDTAEGIKGFGTEADRASALANLFGRAGVAMSEIFKDGADGINEFTKRAQDLGIILPQSVIANVAKFNDQFAVFGLQVKAIGNNITGALAPALSIVVTRLSELLTGAKGTADGFDALGKSIAINILEGLKTAGTAIQAFLQDSERLFLTFAASGAGEFFGFQLTESQKLKVELINLEKQQEALTKKMEKPIESVIPLIVNDMALLQYEFDGVSSRIARIRKELGEDLPSEENSLITFMDELIQAVKDGGSGFEELFKLVGGGFTNLQDPLDVFRSQLNDVEKTIKQTAVGAMKKFEDSIIEGLKTGKLSFKNFADYVIEQLLRIAIQQAILKPITGKFENFFENLFPSKENKALGGFVGAGKPYMVGESGRELFIPNQSGQIVSNQDLKQMGGQAAPTVNFNISTVDAAGFDQLLASRKGLITSIINNAMNNQGKMGIV